MRFLCRLTGRVPAFLSLPRTKRSSSIFQAPPPCKDPREESARGGAALDVNEPVGCPGLRGSRSEDSAAVPIPSLRLGPVEKLPVRGTNLIIFINRRSSAMREGGGGGEVKVGAAEERERGWEREVRPWKVTVVAESSI